MSEVWKDIKNYEGYYQVSNLGRVKSLRRKRSDGGNLRERILKLEMSKDYLRVRLCKEGKIERFLVHRLVAIAFVFNPDNKLYINHKNGIKYDSKDVNLEWCTASENQKHAYKKLGKIVIKGEAHVNSKLTEKDVVQIRKSNLKHKKLAEIFQVSNQLISAIKNNKKWEHI